MGWDGITKNKKLTIEFIEKYIDDFWNLYYLSRNPMLSIDSVEKYIDKSWDWEGISCNHFETDYNNILQKLEKIENFNTSKRFINSKCWHPNRI